MVPENICMHVICCVQEAREKSVESIRLEVRHVESRRDKSIDN